MIAVDEIIAGVDTEFQTSPRERALVAEVLRLRTVVAAQADAIVSAAYERAAPELAELEVGLRDETLFGPVGAYRLAAGREREAIIAHIESLRSIAQENNWMGADTLVELVAELKAGEHVR